MQLISTVGQQKYFIQDMWTANRNKKQIGTGKCKVSPIQYTKAYKGSKAPLILDFGSK